MSSSSVREKSLGRGEESKEMNDVCWGISLLGPEREEDEYMVLRCNSFEQKQQWMEILIGCIDMLVQAGGSASRARDQMQVSSLVVLFLCRKNC